MVLELALAAATFAPAQTRPISQPGELGTLDREGRMVSLCPLERTSVTANISGFGAEVTVVQKFANPSKVPIEAIYTFPLPNDSAVYRMRMRIGQRVIEGEIMKREDAFQTYQAAKAAGQATALLDQERPNIFTQSVANIMPGSAIEVEISYVQLVKYDQGVFEFHFPMTVAPRYLGNTTDPQKVDPPRTTRTGTNIDLKVNVVAGAPVSNVVSVLHQATSKTIPGGFSMTLAKRDEIPNRDFILKYAVAPETVKPAFISHMDERGGFFSMVLFPPKVPKADQIAPREVIFVVDQSGSQQGFPIIKSKELCLKMMETLRPGDTFNALSFNTEVRTCFEAARPVNAENLDQARKFVTGIVANGGTQIGPAVIESLYGQGDPERLRMVLFNTDGLVGDEYQILETLQKGKGKARIFTFGIGNSVNRFLIDAMAVEGRGASEIITLETSADAAVSRLLKRTRSPILTDLGATFTGGAVTQVQPGVLADVFAEQPIVVYGRYSQAGPGEVRLTGRLGGKPWSMNVPVVFSDKPSAPAIPVLWARQRVEEIKRSDFMGIRRGVKSRVAELTTNVALDFGIMSEYTSFVAVEKRIVNVGGRQRTVVVPVEMAKGVFERAAAKDEKLAMKSLPNLSLGSPARPGSASAGASGGGQFGGGGGGTGATGATRATGSTGTGGSASKTRAQMRGGLIGSKLDYITYDPNDNSILIKPEAKISAKLKTRLDKAKGPIAVQVRVKDLSATTMNLLKKLGLKIEDKDKSLKVVFGTIDAAKIKELIKVSVVLRVDEI